MEVQQISPFLGAVVKGVQVSQLSKEGLDELALFVAEKKVVAFRDQDFKDLSPERQIEIARYDCAFFFLLLELRSMAFYLDISDQSSCTRPPVT